MYRVETFGDGAEAMRAKMEKLLDVKPFLKSGVELLAESQKKNIEQSRTPEGDPFLPLKTERIKRVAIADGWAGDIVRHMAATHPYGRKPLLDTTNMYQSIHYDLLDDRNAFAGPSLQQAPYFPYQNQGAPRRGIPARTYIGIRTEDATALEDLALHHTLDAMQ